MKSNKSTVFVAALFFIIGFSTVGYAADATVGFDTNSAYVWRGITFNDGIVVQPYMDITKGGFNANVWGNYDMDDYDDSIQDNQFQEVDLTLSYGFSIKALSISVGYIEYLFPNVNIEKQINDSEDPSDIENVSAGRDIFLGFGVEPVSGLSLELTLYYEVDQVEDMYVNAGISYSYGISDALSVSIGVSAGYAGDEYSASGDGGMSDINASLSTSYQINEMFGVSAGIYFTDTLDEDVLPEQDVTSYGGVGLSCAF